MTIKTILCAPPSGLQSFYCKTMKTYFCYNFRYLATGHSISSLHYQFLIGKSTASYLIRDTCSIIWDVLKEVVFPKPTTDEWAKIADIFWQQCNFPNCVGAIDGKHIRIQKPVGSGSSFYNYKKYFSFVLFAMADANYRFIYVDIGSYGRSSDSSIFTHSTLGHLLQENRLALPANTPLPGTIGPAMPYVFVADEAFALGEHLLRPYSSHSLSQEKRVFNYRLTRARRVVECAFGILANKWRLLHTPIYLKMQHAIQAVKAICALHNFIREHDGFQFEDTLANQAMTRAEMTSTRGSRSGAALRETLCSYFMSPEGQLPWQLDAIA